MDREDDCEMRVTSALAVANDFARGAAHDLRQPLRGLKHATTMLEHELEAPSASVQKRLTQILERVARLETLVDEIRAYVSTTHASAVEPCRLEDLLTQAREQLFVDCKDLNAAVTVSVAPTAATATIAPHAVRGAVRALLLNSVTHHDGELPAIDVCASRDGDFLRIEVTDDGPGIAPALLDRAKTAFATLSRSEHAGLGLALVQHLALQHGGDFQLHSPIEYGRGTRAIVRVKAEAVT